MKPLAVLGGTPLRDGRRPYPAWPQWDDAERAALAATLDSGGWWQGDGSRAQRFADRFAARQDARFGLAFTNGTHTMEAALLACGIGEGDEVIVPALTFVATATAVLAANAVPVIVDVDAETLDIDVAAAEAAVGERTRAVIAVHVAGVPCDLDALVDLCQRRGLHLIEDCAHAHGSSWRGRGVGSFGSFGSFSFQQSKLLTAGEGGALISSDPELTARARMFLDCGREDGEWFYHHAVAGSNYRMTEWQGAVLGAQLDRFPQQHARRNANAVALGEALGGVGGLRAQRRDPRVDSVGNYCFVFHYDAAEFAGLPLRSFEQALAAEGIPLGVSYPPLHTLALFREAAFAPRLRASAPDIDYAALSLPVAEHVAAATVWVEHRLLLAEPDDALDLVRAAEKIRRHAAALAAEVAA